MFWCKQNRVFDWRGRSWMVGCWKCCGCIDSSIHSREITRNWWWQVGGMTMWTGIDNMNVLLIVGFVVLLYNRQQLDTWVHVRVPFGGVPYSTCSNECGTVGSQQMVTTGYIHTLIVVCSTTRTTTTTCAQKYMYVRTGCSSVHVRLILHVLVVKKEGRG